MSMNDEIINRQKKWAEDNGIKLRDEEHTRDVYSNLYGHCLYRDFEEDIKQGNGNELYDHIGHPAKMSSLRSSSALCVNVFAPQVDNCRNFPSIGMTSLFSDNADCKDKYELYFEDKHSTGAGSYANLDIALKNGIEDVFIECKFLEPYDHMSTGTVSILKQGYLDISDSKHPKIKEKFIRLLPEKLVDELSTWPKITYKNRGKECTGITCSKYRIVDLAQLIKHILGLMNTYNDPSKFKLLYLYYKADDLQKDELERIKEMLTEGCRKIQFDYVSYQDYVARLRKSNRSNTAHLKYLEDRYGL